MKPTTVYESVQKTPSPNCAKGGILTLDRVGRLQCLDPKTGELRCSKKISGKCSASPIVADRIALVENQAVTRRAEARVRAVAAGAAATYFLSCSYFFWYLSRSRVCLFERSILAPSM